MGTPEITRGPPWVAKLIGALSVTVTTFEDSLMAVMAEAWSGPTLGSEKTVGVPIPVATELWAAGVKAVITSASPGTRLPALVTKTRELLGRMAACVGLIPML